MEASLPSAVANIPAADHQHANHLCRYWLVFCERSATQARLDLFFHSSLLPL